MAKEYIWKCKRCGKLITREKCRKIVGQRYEERLFKNHYNINLCILCHNEIIKYIKGEKSCIKDL